MKKTIISLLLVAALMLSMSVAAMAGTFPDVKDDYKYSSAIDLLASLNVLGGYEDGTFRPESKITRAELAKILYVVYGGSDDPMANLYVGESQFKDVAKNVWFNGHVNWATTNSIVGGYGDGTFLPNNNIAVKEAIKMIVASVTDKTLTYPMGYIQEARALGLLDDVTVDDVNAYATRGQIAQMAYNLLYTPSRLCLRATGEMNSNGTEVYKKVAPIEFVFGLTAIGGDETNSVSLVATYENMWTYTGGTLEENEIALDINGKTYVFEYAGDANDLFGQDLIAYIDTPTVSASSELVSVVSNSVVYSTTQDKLTGNGTSAYPFKVDGNSMPVGNLYTASNTRFYAFDTVYTQGSNGYYTKTDTDAGAGKYLKVADYFSKDGNNSSNKVTLIDRDNDGVYETLVISNALTVQVNAATNASKTMKFAVAVAGKTQFASIYVNGFDAFTGLDYSGDPIYANVTVSRRGDGQAYLDAKVAQTKIGVLSSVGQKGTTAVVDGTTYQSTGKMNETGVFASVDKNIGDTVKMYFDANGYVAAVVVTEETETHELSFGKVIFAQDDADKWGNNKTASIKVVLSDGTEKTIELAVDSKVDDILTAFDGDTAKSWLTSGADNEVFFSYNTTDKKFNIVDNYIHFEIDDDTQKASRIVAISDIEAVGGPTNTELDWEVKSFKDNLSYNEDKGFFIGNEKKVTSYVGFAAENFKGMYYAENERGEIESFYYTAANIPEFYEEGEYTLVFADGEVVAMIVLASPEATSAQRVLGVVESFRVVAGENKTANGTNTFRLEITMIVDGEKVTYYTEDAVSNKLVNAEGEGEKLEAGRLVYIQLLSNGKVAVKESSDGKVMVDLEYLSYGNVQFGYATYNRGSYYRVYNVSALTNSVEAGWVTDKNGNLIYNEEAISGEIKADSSYVSLMSCDETKIFGINTSLDDFDAEDTQNGKLLEAVNGIAINKLDKITLSDADNGVYYMFFYTLLTEETAEDSDNIGAIDTVYVYEVPSVID